MKSAGRRSTRVVRNQRLGGWLLVDDEEAIRAPHDIFECCVLMARHDREAIVLSANFFVFSESHEDALVATDLSIIRTATLAVELQCRLIVRKARRPVQLFDFLVDLANECLVARLPLLTLIHKRVLRRSRPADKGLRDSIAGPPARRPREPGVLGSFGLAEAAGGSPAIQQGG